MKKLALLIILGLVAGAIAGCGDSPTAVQSGQSHNWVQGSAEDRAEVAAGAAAYPVFMDDGFYQSEESMSSQALGPDGTLSATVAIDPITFSRRVRVTDQSFEFAFADTDTTGRPTLAILTVHKDMTGVFRILADDTTGGFNPPVTIRKPISERWTRRLQFERDTSSGGGDDNGDDDDDDDGDDDSARRLGRDETAGGLGNGHGHGRGRGGNRARWELTAVSGIEIDTEGFQDRILSLRLEGSGLDTTITDALELFPVAGLPTLAPGSVMTITATTASSDDIVLLLSRNRRIRLQSNGDNTYSGTFTVPESFGCHHFGVNALSDSTLFDDTAPYNSETWILPVIAGSAALARAR